MTTTTIKQPSPSDLLASGGLQRAAHAGELDGREDELRELFENAPKGTQVRIEFLNALQKVTRRAIQNSNPTPPEEIAKRREDQQHHRERRRLLKIGQSLDFWPAIIAHYGDDCPGSAEHGHHEIRRWAQRIGTARLACRWRGCDCELDVDAALIERARQMETEAVADVA